MMVPLKATSPEAKNRLQTSMYLILSPRESAGKTSQLGEPRSKFA